MWVGPLFRGPLSLPDWAAMLRKTGSRNARLGMINEARVAMLPMFKIRPPV